MQVLFFFFMISFCFFCMDVFFEYLWRINFMIFEGLNYVLQYQNQLMSVYKGIIKYYFFKYLVSIFKDIIFVEE